MFNMVFGRKDKENTVKMSPLNERETPINDTTDWRNNGGFHRNEFKQTSQNIFDEMFGYNREFGESLDYYLTKESEGNKLYENGIEVINPKDSKGKNITPRQILLDNKLKAVIDCSQKKGIKKEEKREKVEKKKGEGKAISIQKIWKSLPAIKENNNYLTRTKRLATVHFASKNSAKVSSNEISFSMFSLKLSKEGKKNLIVEASNIVTYKEGLAKPILKQNPTNKEGLVFFEVNKKDNSIKKEPSVLLISDNPIEAISYAQLEKIDNYVVISTAGEPTRKQLDEIHQTGIVKEVNVPVIVVASNGYNNKKNALLLEKVSNANEIVTPVTSVRTFNQLLKREKKETSSRKKKNELINTQPKIRNSKSAPQNVPTPKNQISKSVAKSANTKQTKKSNPVKPRKTINRKANPAKQTKNNNSNSLKALVSSIENFAKEIAYVPTPPDYGQDDKKNNSLSI